MVLPAHTHRLAVNAYLIREDRFLLLKRTSEPLIWTPPGGRLRRDEDPVEGLKREVMEETGLTVNVLTPANIWFGEWRKIPLMSIDFLTLYREGEVRLSREHSDYSWVSLNELRSGKPVSLQRHIGFTLENFEHAQNLKQFYDKWGKDL